MTTPRCKSWFPVDLQFMSIEHVLVIPQRSSSPQSNWETVLRRRAQPKSVGHTTRSNANKFIAKQLDIGVTTILVGHSIFIREGHSIFYMRTKSVPTCWWYKALFLQLNMNKCYRYRTAIPHNLSHLSYLLFPRKSKVEIAVCGK